MKDLVAWKVISTHSKVEFDGEMLEFATEHQQVPGREVTTQFTPLMQLNGKPLYVAYLEARE